MSQTNDSGAAIVATIVLFVVSLLITAFYIAGRFDSCEEQRRQAIEAGVGRYVTDETTGDTTFVYGVKP